MMDYERSVRVERSVVWRRFSFKPSSSCDAVLCRPQPEVKGCNALLMGECKRREGLVSHVVLKESDGDRRVGWWYNG